MITDVLREWVRYLDDNPHLGSLTDFGKQGIVNLADRIDEQHRKALEKVAAMVDEPDEKRRAYYDRFIAPMVDGCPLEARVERIERLLNHKGA